MKTNKSWTKRLRITKKGKLLRRATGQNHFNAKESRRSQLNSKKSIPFAVVQRIKRRFITVK